MNEGYEWGGRNGNFYVRMEDGRIVDRIEEQTDGTFLVHDRGIERYYVDAVTARQAVELITFDNLEFWRVYNEKNYPTTKVETKKWWEIWK